MRLLFLETGEGPPRLGAAVGKRQGSSVVRSRGRRVLREAFRACRPWVKEGLWIVAMLRSAGLESRTNEVYAELVRLLDKEGFLKPGYPYPFQRSGTDRE